MNNKEDQHEIINENQIDLKIVNNNSFCSIFCNNFLELYPFICIFRASIITPLLIRFSFFLFNASTLFGFNAVYFVNKYLNERIKHSNRDDFMYPLTHDYTRIIAAIVSSMIIAVIMRLIMLVSFTRKEKLRNDIKESQDKVESVKNFTNEFFVRRLIVQIVMLIIAVVFFYITFAFCNRYPKAQYSWAKAFVWSIIFTYVPLSLIYILVVSIVESAKGNTCKSCAYYAKRVFMF